MASGASSIRVPHIRHPDDPPSPIRDKQYESPKFNSESLSRPTPSTPKKHPKVQIKVKTPRAQNQQYLADTIPRYFEISTFDSQERQYLPEECLKKHIVTKETVDREFCRAPEFKDYDSQDLAPVSSWVVDLATKVFAITVQCHLDPSHLLSSMLNFYNEDFDDDKLPISDPRAPSPERARPARTSAFSGDEWSDQRHDEFFRFQWSCLAPVFVPDRYEYDLLVECILPFIRVKDTDPRTGSFSSVFKVIVQSDHQQRHSLLEVCLF